MVQFRMTYPRAHVIKRACQRIRSFFEKDKPPMYLSAVSLVSTHTKVRRKIKATIK